MKVAEFSLEGTGAAVDIETTRPGNEITGTFTLSFQGYETDPIAFDASPEEMQERLEALASVETVEVTRSNGAITNPGGFVWDGYILVLERSATSSARGKLPWITVDRPSRTTDSTCVVVVMNLHITILLLNTHHSYHSHTIHNHSNSLISKHI